MPCRPPPPKGPPPRPHTRAPNPLISHPAPTCPPHPTPPQIYVPPHPLVGHWVAVLRNKGTPGPVFRNAAAELGRILIYEAARDWLETVEGQVCMCVRMCVRARACV
jgi:hypothetical protein